MALPDTWLMGVLNAGGSSEPLPVPQIPADYLQRPRRQRPASEQTRPLSSHLPPPPASFSSLNRRRAALAEIDDPNSQPQRKRQRVPKAPTPVVLQVPPLPSKLQSHIAARKVEDTRNKAPAVDVMDDPSVTPRPFRTRRKLASTPVTALDETAKPALIPSASEDKIGIDREDMEPASSVTESIGSKRSRSPTKRMVDLQVAEKKVVPKTAKSPADVPEDVRGLYRAIQSLARVPRGVIPLGIEDEIVKDAGGEIDDLDLFVATKANGMTREQLMDEFKALRGIRDSTAFCKTKHVHEPTWNERVHSRMLEQAVHNRPGFEYHNITTARVIKELVPGNKYGELLKNKMIDYAIILVPPLFHEAQVITRLAASLRPLQRTINPSDYSPLCYNPVAISIETKSPDGGKENGEVQLSIWAMAYFNRLRTLTQDPLPITLPLLLISDERWKLFFARDLESSHDIIEAVDFGDSGDIIGCYTVLAVLGLLCEWAEATFLPWFLDSVLKPE